MNWTIMISNIYLTMKALVLLCGLVCLAAANEERIFRPIKEGQDVGLVVIPGAYLAPEQYYAVVGSIQEESEFALWVYVEDTPTDQLPIPRTDFVIKSKEALQDAGLPVDAPYCSIGHSMGGGMMMIELDQDPTLVDGIITWGAGGFLTPENVPILNVPAMTMAGDMEGMTKITYMAEHFLTLEPLPMATRLISPVRTLVGLNHTSYNTGPTPLVPLLRDLPAEIEGEEARRIIAENCSFFIDFSARRKLGLDTTADLETLQEWFDYQSEVFAPIIAALYLEESGSLSPWVVDAQRLLGNAYEDEVVIENYVMDKESLVASRSIVVRIDDDTVLGNTTVTVPSQQSWTSAPMLEAKMSSQEMFDEVLGREPSSKTTPTCRDVNVAAWNLIYPTISAVTRSRFEALSFTVNFKPDDMQVWGPGWVESEMEFSSDGQTLNITSSGLKTPTGFPGVPGSHYCKLLSPFRIIEFLYVESRRAAGF